VSEPLERTRSDAPAPAEGPATAGEGHAPPAEGKGRRSFLAELPVLVLIAFVLALLLKTFLVQAFFIPSSSMEPTLSIHDRVLVNKTAYTFREPHRGEVVVFTDRIDNGEPVPDEGLVERAVSFVASGFGFGHQDDRDYIKRIIGLPGETLEMRDGIVRIDGEPLPEATATDGGYLTAPDLTDYGPVEIPEGQYFMMGDNRPNSADSRVSIGTVPRDDIVGRAFVVIWPLPRVDTLPIAAYDETLSPPSAADGDDAAATGTRPAVGVAP
jgi:signal peptidase I